MFTLSNSTQLYALQAGISAILAKEYAVGLGELTLL